MSKYNIGDIVKLRDDLDIGEEYGIVGFLYGMKTLKNKALRIDRIDTEDDGCTIYEVDGWWISEEMIEGLWEEKQDKLKLIDVLNMIAKGELKEGTKVKYKGVEFIYEDNELYDDDGDNICCYMCDRFDLTIEVELIEPPCEHEWLDWETHRMGEGRIRRYRRCNKCGLEEETEDNHFADVGKMENIEELKLFELDQGTAIDYKIAFKLNEVIRKINKE